MIAVRGRAVDIKDYWLAWPSLREMRREEGPEQRMNAEGQESHRCPATQEKQEEQLGFGCQARGPFLKVSFIYCLPCVCVCGVCVELPVALLWCCPPPSRTAGQGHFHHPEIKKTQIGGLYTTHGSLYDQRGTLTVVQVLQTPVPHEEYYEYL